MLSSVAFLLAWFWRWLLLPLHGLRLARLRQRAEAQMYEQDLALRQELAALRSAIRTAQQMEAAAAAAELSTWSGRRVLGLSLRARLERLKTTRVDGWVEPVTRR